MGTLVLGQIVNGTGVPDEQVVCKEIGDVKLYLDVFKPERSQPGRYMFLSYECVADGKSVIRWIRQHESALGVDSDCIAAGCGSAGAQVATATTFDEPSEGLKVSAKPNALVPFSPVLWTRWMCI